MTSASSTPDSWKSESPSSTVAESSARQRAAIDHDRFAADRPPGFGRQHHAGVRHLFGGDKSSLVDVGLMDQGCNARTLSDESARDGGADPLSRAADQHNLARERPARRPRFGVLHSRNDEQFGREGITPSHGSYESRPNPGL